MRHDVSSDQNIMSDWRVSLRGRGKVGLVDISLREPAAHVLKDLRAHLK